MFLRANKRVKDGKTHRYWSVIENRRVAGGGSVQKPLLYLGEINDSDRASWTRAIEAVDERARTQQIHLFAEDGKPSDQLAHPSLKLSVSIRTFRRGRDTSPNAVKTQIWIAVCTYLMIAILHKQLKLPGGLHRTLQLLSVHPFEKVPLNQLLMETDHRTLTSYDHNQLNLW